jgi:hypothetical protein
LEEVEIRDSQTGENIYNEEPGDDSNMLQMTSSRHPHLSKT